VILTTRGPGKEERVFTADGATPLGDFPLLILINEQTASAAEIVAGALRDHNRAELLGTRTFGKGSVQTLVMLDAGGALRMTTAYHYLPSGRNIQKRPGAKTWGIDPSDGFYVPLTESQTEALRRGAQKRALLEQQPGPPLTAKSIEENFADLQLATAVRSMVTRLTGGTFLKVGRDSGAALDQAARIEEMRQRMNQLEREITELQQRIGKEKRP
jgi:carboxyl-terminal processing protease